MPDEEYAEDRLIEPGRVWFSPETGYIIPASMLRKYTHLLDAINQPAKSDEDDQCR